VTCSDYDLCVPCFTEAKHTRDHQPATHPYRVIEQHSIPVYTEDWGADEELLLLEGAETYGLGSWADIADHIGGCRTKEEVRDHYIETYVDSDTFPLPVHASPRDRALIDEIPREEFQARKKRRIEERKEATKNAPPAPPKQKPTASVPACHEVQGYMPGRLEFETEYFNEAEEAVQHMQFDPGDGAVPMSPEQEQEFDLKMLIFKVYNERLTARVERKKIIFEHNLLNYKTNQAIDKKRTREQRDLMNRTKPFARMMTGKDYEEFCRGLEEEYALRHAISQLQEYRTMQISELAAGAKYEVEKLARATRGPSSIGAFDRLATNRLSKPVPPVDIPTASSDLVAPDLALRAFTYDGGLNTPPASDTDGHNLPNGHALTNGNGILTPQSASQNQLLQKPKINVAPIPNVSPLKFHNPDHSDAENSADLHLLTPEEVELCRVIRVQPKPYTMIKEAIISEAVNSGGLMKKKQVRELCRLDATKGGRLFEFFVDAGWINKA
jgi:transcriptional adapter 2-alpha